VITAKCERVVDEKNLIVYKTSKTTISVLGCETWRLPVDGCQVSISRVLLGLLDDKADFFV